MRSASAGDSQRRISSATSLLPARSWSSRISERMYSLGVLSALCRPPMVGDFLVIQMADVGCGRLPHEYHAYQGPRPDLAFESWTSFGPRVGGGRHNALPIGSNRNGPVTSAISV